MGWAGFRCGAVKSSRHIRVLGQLEPSKMLCLLDGL